MYTARLYPTQVFFCITLTSTSAMRHIYHMNRLLHACNQVTLADRRNGDGRNVPVRCKSRGYLEHFCLTHVSARVIHVSGVWCARDGCWAGTGSCGWVNESIGLCKVWVERDGEQGMSNVVRTSTFHLWTLVCLHRGPCIPPYHA